VARVLAAIIPPLVRIGIGVEPHQVNGQPGAIFRDRDGQVLNTLTLDILDRLTVSFHKVEGSSGSRCHDQAVDADQLVIMAPPNDDVVIRAVIGRTAH
jgi:hypothetical protein